MPSVLIRAHLNLDVLHDTSGHHGDDDALLTHYSNVAEAWVAAYTGQPFDPDNALMIQAALLLIAHQYENREGVTLSNPYSLPFGVTDLLSPLKTRVTGYVAESA